MDEADAFERGYQEAMREALAIVEAMAGPGFRGTGGLILAYLHGRLKEAAQERAALAA